jgi:hypothetical protein
MKKSIKLILAVLLIAGAIGGVVAYRMWNKPHADASEMEGIKVSADELYKAFESSEQQANATYVGKVVEVTGTVGDIEKSDTISRVMLTFPDAMMGAVRVTLDTRHLQDANEVKTGDQATFKGFCNGFLMDVEVKDGVLVKE